MDCIFCQIVAGDLPADFVSSNDHSIAFRDIHPQAPTHVLVVPRQHVASLGELEDRGLAGHLLCAAAEVARSQELGSGWRLIVNTGEHGGQEVAHLHLHVLGGKPLGPMLSRS